MSFDLIKTPRGAFNLVLVLLCAAMPIIAPAIGQDFYTDVFARTMIWAIAAVSLNLIMGYGGMISFGHAVYIGIGGYAVGILTFHGIESAYIQWPVALVASGLIALIFGVISLRTRGVYFIMITLAFTQMVHFLSVSLEKYGSDDGLTIEARSDFALPFFDLNDAMTLYYFIFVLMMASIFITYKIVNSRFGMVIRGSMSNDDRMRSMGFPTYGYKLAAFVIAGVMCGLAGILSANLEDFVSPDMMSWPRSGDLIFMVVLGGMGTIFGPLGGAIVFWILQEFLSNLPIIGEHWHLIFGPFLVLVVLFARGGIEGIIAQLGGRRG